MLGVTLFGIFLTPVFYYVIQWFTDRRTRNEPVEGDLGTSPLAVDGHKGNGHADGKHRNGHALETPSESDLPLHEPTTAPR